MVRSLLLFFLTLPPPAADRKRVLEFLVARRIDIISDAILISLSNWFFFLVENETIPLIAGRAEDSIFFCFFLFRFRFPISRRRASSSAGVGVGRKRRRRRRRRRRNELRRDCHRR